jgi:pimeloyl-ACP methyl ester carboxylesterase
MTDGLYVDTAAASPERHDAAAPADRIVFVHGAMDRSTSFAKVRSRLRWCETVAYDRRGYARSLGLGPAGAFDDHVADLLGVVDGRRSVLVGHSYGGTVCLAVAARCPQLVAAMVVFEAPMSWEPWWPGHAGGSTIAIGEAQGPESAAEAFMRRIVGEATWEGLSDRTKAERRAEGRALLFDLAGLRGRGTPYDPLAVTVPTVIAHGELSLPHQIRSSTQLYGNLLNAPRSLRSLTGSRHGAHSSDPEGFSALVREAVGLAHAS